MTGLEHGQLKRIDAYWIKLNHLLNDLLLGIIAVLSYNIGLKNDIYS